MKKKSNWLILSILVLLVCTSCASSARLVKKSPLSTLKMAEEKENFVLITVRTDCDTCKEYKEILTEVAKEYGVTFYYIECIESYLEDDDMNNLINNYLYHLETIPTTFLLKDGKSQDSWEGLIEKEELVNWLLDYGYITK